MKKPFSNDGSWGIGKVPDGRVDRLVRYRVNVTLHGLRQSQTAGSRLAKPGSDWWSVNFRRKGVLVCQRPAAKQHSDIRFPKFGERTPHAAIDRLLPDR